MKRKSKEPSVWVVEMLGAPTKWHRIEAYARLNEARRGFHAMTDRNPSDEFRIAEYVRRIPRKKNRKLTQEERDDNKRGARDFRADMYGGADDRR